MNSLQAFFDRVQKVRQRLGIERHAAWYRGHARESFRLLPGILRIEDGTRHEWNLYAEFKQKARDLIERDIDSWELLARMQHHGMPTRLLDWTEDLNTAIYFALSSADPEPVIWVLNPYDLNDRAMKKRVVFDAVDRIDFEYSTAAKKREWPNDAPLAMRTAWHSPRISAQSGCFTCHGSKHGPVDELGGSAVKRIVVPRPLVDALRTHLKLCGVDDFKVFPDLDGLSRSLRKHFGFH